MTKYILIGIAGIIISAIYWASLILAILNWTNNIELHWFISLIPWWLLILFGLVLFILKRTEKKPDENI